MKEAIHRFDPAAEYDTPERCYINELCNTAVDPDVSIARARVASGVTTRWHRLRDTNTGPVDLVFLAICTPRFVPDAYEDIDERITPRPDP